jgi:hypothetical protein
LKLDLPKQATEQALILKTKPYNCYNRGKPTPTCLPSDKPNTSGASSNRSRGSHPRSPNDHRRSNSSFSPRLTPDKCTTCGQSRHIPRQLKLSNSASAHANALEAHYQSSDSGSEGLDLTSPLSTADACVIESFCFEKFPPSSSVMRISTPILSLEGSNSPWILDSGATKHVIGCRTLLGLLEPELEICSVKTARGQAHKVVGKGQATIKFPSGTITNIPGVLYVPGVTKNLLSVGAITDSGILLIFQQILMIYLTQLPKT